MFRTDRRAPGRALLALALLALRRVLKDPSRASRR
jgi:hypothetical protein